MNDTITLFMLGLAAAVLWRVVRVASTLDAHSFDGHRLRFVCLVCHWALLGAGSLAVAIGAPIGGPMLLLAVALLAASDRRVH